MDDVSNFCPAMAVPITVKMPEPITAPMPRAVNETGPRVFLSLRSGSSESEISLSIDLQQNSWLSEVRITAAGSVDGCDKRLWSPELRPLRMSAGGQQSRLRRSGLCRPVTKSDGLFLPLRLASSQFFDLGLFRPASIVAGLQRFFRLALLARGTFCFLAVFFAQFRRVCHE